MRSEDAIVFIEFGKFPLEISFHAAKDYESDGKGSYHDMVECARQNKPGEAIAVIEFSYHGAYDDFFMGRLLPKALLNGCHATDGVSREECAKYERCRDLARSPARDVDGKGVPCVLDHIDHVLIDARLNFRPPSSAASGNNLSSSSTVPKTIFEYVERKVAAMELDPVCMRVKLKSNVRAESFSCNASGDASSCWFRSQAPLFDKVTVTNNSITNVLITRPWLRKAI